MKKAIAVLSILALVAGFAFATGKAEAPAEEKAPATTSVWENIPDEKLVAAAKEEGTVTVYASSSRIAKAAETFEAKYGIKVEYANLKDFELIEKVSTECMNKAKGADFILAQDLGRLQGELIDTGFYYNWVPEDKVEGFDPDLLEPLAAFTINKVFIYNNEKTGDEEPYSNIWEFADPKFAGVLNFKNPFQEGVNANFLTMVTSDKVAAKIAAAYESYYGQPIELADDEPNAGYAWIKRIYQNDLINGTSDTKIAEAVGVKGQETKNTPIGLFVYSKARYVKSKNLALKPALNIEPFSGFYYNLYLLVNSTAEHPNAAKLFIKYLLTPEGFAPWGKDAGTYSVNPTIPVADPELDMPFAEWKPILVGEEGAYTFEHRAEVEEFLNQFIY